MIAYGGELSMPGGCPARLGWRESREVRGERRPKELAHAVLMTEWVQALDPDADEAQLLAARGAAGMVRPVPTVTLGRAASS